jgi:hypothetical protein
MGASADDNRCDMAVKPLLVQPLVSSHGYRFWPLHAKEPLDSYQTLALHR